MRHVRHGEAQISVSPPVLPDPAWKQLTATSTKTGRLFNLVSCYAKPPQNELDFLGTLHEDERNEKIRPGVADQIEMVQLRKVINPKLDVLPEEMEFIRHRADQFGVSPRF